MVKLVEVENSKISETKQAGMAVTTVDLGFMEQDYDPWEVD